VVNSKAFASNVIRGLVLAVLPVAALAEGAVKQLACEVVQICDGGGNCESAAGDVHFRMEPVSLDAVGGGEYTISYESTQVAMQASSDIGPFVWSVGTERHALLASSETEWLWHRLSLAAGPEATVRFLVCALQQ
jgi:hypothetical protein